ncbi:MAG: hypothetical protein II086_01190, partial [Ruminococcus sp.]|nr:hypothetical protein [Ruminococcus sp.]
IVSIAQVGNRSQNRAANRRKQGGCKCTPLRFTAAGNADRKPFLRVPVQFFLGATFFEVGVKNNAVISDNRMSIEKTGDF